LFASGLSQSTFREPMGLSISMPKFSKHVLTLEGVSSVGIACYCKQRTTKMINKSPLNLPWRSAGFHARAESRIASWACRSKSHVGAHESPVRCATLTETACWSSKHEWHYRCDCFV